MITGSVGRDDEEVIGNVETDAFPSSFNELWGKRITKETQDANQHLKTSFQDLRE